MGEHPCGYLLREGPRVCWGVADAGRHLLRCASSQVWRQAATSAQAALAAWVLLLPNPVAPRNAEAAAAESGWEQTAAREGGDLLPPGRDGGSITQGQKFGSFLKALEMGGGEGSAGERTEASGFFVGRDSSASSVFTDRRDPKTNSPQPAAANVPSTWQTLPPGLAGCAASCPPPSGSHTRCATLGAPSPQGGYRRP